MELTATELAQTNFIAYACVSTAGQCSSLAEQEMQIKQFMTIVDVDYMMVLPAIQSRRDGMDNNLRKTIQKNKRNSKNVILVVTSFDRITRNVKDLPFLKKYVYKVYEIRTGRLLIPDNYDHEVQLAQTEIQIIAERAKNRRRTICEKPSKNELKRRARNRLANAWNAIQMNPVNEMIVEQHNKVQSFIELSQLLTSENTWQQLSTLSREMGGNNVMEDYINEVRKNKELKLSRSDAFYYANLFHCFKGVSDNLVKEYLNAIYRLVHLNDDEEECKQSNYDVYEGTNHTVDDELIMNEKIMVGDTISYITNNQEGYKKYEVVLNEEDGTKKLMLIDCYEYEICEHMK
jgi:hypothetical protein